METNLGRVRGSMWYAGTGITGISTTPIVFSDSGVTKAYTLDKYLNTDTGNTYECVTAGAADTAEWVYTGCIQGPMPEVVNSLTSSSTTKALSAAQGKVLNDRIAGAGLYPYGVIPKSEQTSYTAQVTIENKSTVLTFKDNADNTGTHTYSKVGDADTAVVNVSIGTTIGFPSSGAVITSIGSSEAVIYNFTLFDNDSQVIYEATPNIWDGINSNDADVKAGGTVSEIYNGTTVNYRDGIISKLIDGVRTVLYPITHAKATWFNKQANKTVYDAVTDIMGSTDVFSPTKNYAAGDYTIYQSAVYRFKTAHTGAWNASHVTKISLSQLNTNLTVFRLTHINGWNGVYVDLLRDHKTCELRVSGTLGRALDVAGFPICGWANLTDNDMRFINYSVTGVDFDTGKSLKLYTEVSEGIVFVYLATCGEQIPAGNAVNCCFHWISRLA